MGPDDRRPRGGPVVGYLGGDAGTKKRRGRPPEAVGGGLFRPPRRGAGDQLGHPLACLRPPLTTFYLTKSSPALPESASSPRSQRQLRPRVCELWAEEFESMQDALGHLPAAVGDRGT